MNKKIITISVVIIVFLLFGYYLIKDKGDGIDFIEVGRGDITRDIFESGTLKKGEEITIGFKTSGRIEEVYVSSGDRVEKNDILLKLENEDLKIQLEKAERGLEMSRITLSKLETGPAKEEADVYKSAVSSAERSLLNAEVSLEDARRALVASIRDAHVKSEDAVHSRIDKFFTNPRTRSANFEVSIEDGNTAFYFITSPELKRDINDRRVRTEEELDNLKSISEKEDPLLYVSEIESSLNEIISFLDKVALAMNSFSVYEYAYQATLAGYKTDVSTARSSVSLALSSFISSLTSYNSAKSAYASAKESLKQAESQLNLILTGARDEDIEIQRATVRQAEAEVRIIKRQLEESVIRAFSDGVVTDVKKKRGEIIQPGELVLSFLNEDSHQVEVEIYEGEIARISIEDEAIIELVAFPYQTFEGRVVSIESSSRLIDGVVYYRILVDVYDLPKEAMPGMTADITIKTIEKEDVLVVSELAVSRREGKAFVNVLVGNDIEEREVELGARGDGRLVEVITGLREGEKVLLR